MWFSGDILRCNDASYYIGPTQIKKPILVELV